MAATKTASPELTARFELLERVGEGTTGVVHRALSRSDGAIVALKVARPGQNIFALGERAILARVQRRWGPTLLDLGVARGKEVPPSVWMATSWIEGAALDVRSPPTSAPTLAAIVAHGVGRGLDELHRAGVRHGDVKPANIIVRGSSPPTIDRAADRGATLIDLDLASDVTSTSLLGGTPRYLAPELRAGEAPTPAADLYALGLVLAEILCPELAAAPLLDASAISRALLDRDQGEARRWIEALIAPAPGARPPAGWIAARAAQALSLASDRDEIVLDRQARVHRTYLAARGSLFEGPSSRVIDPQIDGPARTWLAEACDLLARAEAPSRMGAPLAPLDPLRASRWLVSLIGPIASMWSGPQLTSMSEGKLATRLLELSRHTPPEAWTLDDIVGTSKPSAIPGGAPTEEPTQDTWLSLTRELARSRPTAQALDQAERELERSKAPRGFVRDLASALLRTGDVGRAFAALQREDPDDDDDGDPIILLRAEIARRRGERDEARRYARRLVASFADPATRTGAIALLARLAWDERDYARADEELASEQATSSSPAILEVRALLGYARGDYDQGLFLLDEARATAQTEDGLALARLEGTRGMLEHARGRAVASLEAFSRAVDLATRAGAIVEEATYLTGLAAAAVDAGMTASAIASATRGALLWERLGRPSLAARAHLSRAAAFALIGASHEADAAAEEAMRAAIASGDTRAAAYARWAIVETRAPGDDRARREALAAADELEAAGGAEEDRVRAAARVLLWAAQDGSTSSLRLDPQATDERVQSLSASARWEWWGARASSPNAHRRPSAQRTLAEIIALLDVPAPIGSRGPALASAARLARALGDGEAARRIEAARRVAANTLREGAPPEHRAALSSIGWLEGMGEDDTRSALPAAQVGELESIVRALSSRDRLKSLLEQVVDTMVLWTGVERGLLLLRAPDGKLVPRAARNLARQDLAGEQLALSTSLARRAMSEREAILATDAFAQVGDVHASVHALGLRSVLAVPLIARGDVLGVVYLDDRVRRGAFGPGELAWVRLVASQAALAIADARDQTLLRRAVRRAERANARLAADLGAREVELANVRAELASTTSSSETRFRYDEIAGRSEPMRAMLRLVDRVTASEVPVLLAGESGTGKELVARAIHGNGPRSARAFVSENCGSVPETLLESTLFGHVRGAFTGASATRAGLFDVADGGTLFLDEIGEMPLTMQTKLLRVLQNGEVRPVGGERSRTVNVRIIGATHRDLEAMVAAGTFREDLFYRLNVVSIRIPPLRERREDIPLLVSRFVEKYQPKDRKVKVTRAAMERLTTFPWPGNVRQLENEMRRALVLADDRIDVGELSEEVSRGGPSAARDAGLGLKARVDALEAQLVKDALQKTSGNQTRAAEVLGISRFGLQKMMRRLGIKAS